MSNNGIYFIRLYVMILLRFYLSKLYISIYQHLFQPFQQFQLKSKVTTFNYARVKIKFGWTRI